jgi:cytoskeletal protein CcmA (bactofilin family)
MFGNRKKIRTTKIDTLIGRRSEMLGDVKFAGGLHVDGTVKGNVVAEEDPSSVLTLSETGSIEGDVRVPNIVVNGTVIGDVHAKQHIELAPNARITGNVYYSLIEMAMGAEVNGNLVHVAEDMEAPLQLGHEARFGMVEES